MKGYYLVSKPLQYFNVTNIEDGATHRTCVIVDIFHNSEDFYVNIKKQNYWDEVFFFLDSAKAYKWLKKNVGSGDCLYIDSDYGFKKTVWLSRIKSNNIYVYEEGTGSYRNDLVTATHKNYLIKYFLRSVGIREFMGGGRYTKGIILYDLEKHIQLVPEYSKERRTFKREFAQHAGIIRPHFQFQSIATKELLSQLKSQHILLYLTTWTYNEKVQALINKYPEYIKILKPHPAVKISSVQTNFDITLSGDLFIELFILDLLDICNNIIIAHENSSAMQYINSQKIKNIVLS